MAQSIPINEEKPINDVGQEPVSSSTATTGTEGLKTPGSNKSPIESLLSVFQVSVISQLMYGDHRY